MFYCLFGNVLFALGRGLGGWIPFLLLSGLGANLGVAASQTIIQAKIAPDVQGRVVSARGMMMWLPDTFTPILAGVMADRVMEPAMLTETWLSKTFGWLVGTTPGSGMALIMLFAGILMMLTMFTGFQIPVIRNLEDLIPDHEQVGSG
jgi:hypothetical protein